MKILILLMSCNNEYFINQSNIIKKSLRQQIKKYNLENNIDIYDYVGDFNELYEKNNTIYCTSIDKISGTYLKTIECINYINNNIEYDYIFRTNTSTFINVYLLYNFILKINDPTIIYGSDLYFSNGLCPNKHDIMMRGNGIILSKENINILLNNKYNFVNNEKYKNAGITNDYNNKLEPIINFFIDDTCISTVFNIYYLEQGLSQIDIYNKYRTYFHGWLNCYTGTSAIRHISNGLCEWENININYDFIKNFVTIQVKSYDPNIKYTDNDKIKLLTNIILKNTYNSDEIEKIINNNLNHYKNQKYYIGWQYMNAYITKNELLEKYNEYKSE